MNLEGILHQLVEEKKFRKLRGIFEEMNEVDIAEFIQELEQEKVVLVFRLLPKELGAEVFACLDVDMQEFIINSMSDYELQKIVEELFIDDAVDMLEELPATVVRRVLANAKPDTRALINQFHILIDGKHRQMVIGSTRWMMVRMQSINGYKMK